jgi:hypothetical protein
LKKMPPTPVICPAAGSALPAAEKVIDAKIPIRIKPARIAAPVFAPV